MQIIIALILISLLILLFSVLPGYGKFIIIAIILTPIIFIIYIINSTPNNSNTPDPITKVSDNKLVPVFNNPNEKCITEDEDLKICDLSFSSITYMQNKREILTEGNSIACVDMVTGEVDKGKVGQLRATMNTAFCVTDFGYI